MKLIYLICLIYGLYLGLFLFLLILRNNGIYGCLQITRKCVSLSYFFERLFKIFLDIFPISLLIGYLMVTGMKLMRFSEKVLVLTTFLAGFIIPLVSIFHFYGLDIYFMIGFFITANILFYLRRRH